MPGSIGTQPALGHSPGGFGDLSAPLRRARQCVDREGQRPRGLQQSRFTPGASGRFGEGPRVELQLLAEKSGRRLGPEDVGRARADAGPVAEASPRRKCPRCRRKMDGVSVGSADPVHVDRCTEHGVWMDSGELGRIMAQLVPGGSSDEAVIVRFLGETFGSEPAN